MKEAKRKALGEKIRQYRKQAGISVFHLASVIDVKSSELIKYEKGLATVSAIALDDIARALGRETSDFF